jgi:hypothetical protein
MGMMDKLKFWKKEEEFIPDMPRVPESALPEQQMPSGIDQMGMPRPTPGINEPPFEHEQFQPGSLQSPRAFQQQPAMSADQQLQLISSKLDTIKAQLETVLQRLERLERKEEPSPYQQRWRTGV